MKDLLLRVHVVVKTLNLEISRCHLADYVEELYLSACRTCSTIIFPHSTDEIIVFWGRRCRCRRPCLRSLMCWLWYICRVINLIDKSLHAKKSYLSRCVISFRKQVHIPIQCSKDYSPLMLVNNDVSGMCFPTGEKASASCSEPGKHVSLVIRVRGDTYNCDTAAKLKPLGSISSLLRNMFFLIMVSTSVRKTCACANGYPRTQESVKFRNQ